MIPPAKTKNKKAAFGCLFAILAVALIVGLGSNLDTKEATKQTEAPQQDSATIRKELVEKAFSGWDGSHRGLVKYVKDRMNDPESFTHVKTLFKDQGNNVLVEMTYRGKNAFGGTVTETVFAEADVEGNILSLKKE